MLFRSAYAMSILVHKYLAPVHGAFVARNGQGVLLCGDSFAGKSTLAFACARAGWTFLSDDATYLIRSRLDRIAVTNPFFIHLREDAPVFFPELKDHAIAVRPNGKIGIEIPTSGLGIATAGTCPVIHVVFLNRDTSTSAHLASFSKAAAMEWCERYLLYGEQHVIGEQRAALQRLLGAGIWELRYSALDDAIARLEKLTDQGV